MEVRKFDHQKDVDLWNNFLKSGKNKTFLFDRGFMDYHKQRFVDFSLMLFNDAGVLTSLVPANISRQQKDVVVSHEGLTYGGMVVKEDVKIETVICSFYYCLKYLYENGIQHFLLKNFPSFYNIHPTDEVDYIMFLLDATLCRRDIALVIDQKNRIPYTSNIRREGSKAEKMNAKVVEDSDMNKFWKQILIPNLQERFGVNPVHSLEEINLLKENFTDHIRQFNVFLNDQIVGGTTLFIDNKVAHCQYISANAEGRKTGALNFLFKYLIDTVFSGKRYFDFGIVNEENGKKINSGMLFWKEGFGGRAMKHDFYNIDTNSYKNLEKYLQ